MRILVTGANRGIGLEFACQLAARGDRVFACCRLPDQAVDLRALKVQYPNRITIVQLDVTEPSSINSAYETIKSQTDALDMLINNAGITRPDPLGEVDRDAMLHILNVNTVSPILIVQRFLDLLKAGDQPKIINLTSGLGSISGRSSGGKYSYASSKAALNMVTRTLALDMKQFGISTIVIDPGWVQTDMGGPDAWITPQQSISDMLHNVIDNLTLEQSGQFYHHSGKQIPW